MDNHLLMDGARRQAGLLERWRLARGMVKVTDPDGVQWKVYRCLFPTRGIWFLDGDLGEAAVIILPAVWLPWLIAKWLGVRWIISIERNERQVDEVSVRGWRRSQRRIHEIAEAAAAGTLQNELDKATGSQTVLRPISH